MSASEVGKREIKGSVNVAVTRETARDVYGLTDDVYDRTGAHGNRGGWVGACPVGGTYETVNGEYAGDRVREGEQVATRAREVREIIHAHRLVAFACAVWGGWV